MKDNQGWLFELSEDDDCEKMLWHQLSLKVRKSAILEMQKSCKIIFDNFEFIVSAKKAYFVIFFQKVVLDIAPLIPQQNLYKTTQGVAEKSQTFRYF